jgi:hypothetical protein
MNFQLFLKAELKTLFQKYSEEVDRKVLPKRAETLVKNVLFMSRPIQFELSDCNDLVFLNHYNRSKLIF